MAKFPLFSAWSFSRVLRRVGGRSGERLNSARGRRAHSLRLEQLEDRLTPSGWLAAGLLDASHLLDPTAAGGLLSDPISGYTGQNSTSWGHTPLASGFR